jgi:hypothetical protein
MLAATCGIENNLGNLVTPTRACFNKAEDDFLGGLRDLYVQVVMARNATLCANMTETLASCFITRHFPYGLSLETIQTRNSHDCGNTRPPRVYARS